MAKGRSEGPVEIRTCEHCGGRMTSAGRRSKLGQNYCSKPECILAKQRANYRRRADAVSEDQRPDAPTRCACCDGELIPRKARFTDSPLGRWCNRPRCQKHRRMSLSRGQMGENERLILEFTNALAIPQNIVLCQECGLDDAVLGFIHPIIIDGQQDRCLGVGDKGVKRELAALRWPQRMVS